jgi:hypothetical protein
MVSLLALVRKCSVCNSEFSPKEGGVTVATTEIISLLGIVGTLLGTLAGIGLQFLIERRRWRRQDQTRFRDDRYTAYMNLYYRGKHAVERPETQELLDAGDHAGMGAGFTGADKDALVEALWKAATRITLLGSTTLQDATESFVKVVVHIVREGRADEERCRSYKGASDRFLHVARTEIGVDTRR